MGAVAHSAQDQELIERGPALSRGLRCLATARPVLIVGPAGCGLTSLARRLLAEHPAPLLDDVHRSCPSTSSSGPFVATARHGPLLPTWLAELWANDQLERIEVSGLSSAGTAEYTQRLIGGVVPVTTGAVLRARSEGRPRYLRELVHDAVGAGELICVDEIWVPRSSPISAGPRSVDLARILTRELSEEAFQALASLALVGEAPVSLLRQLAPDRVWDDLERTGLVGVGEKRGALALRPPILADAVERGLTAVTRAELRARWRAVAEGVTDGAPPALGHGWSGSPIADHIALWTVEEGGTPPTPTLMRAVRRLRANGHHDAVVDLSHQVLAADHPLLRLQLADSLAVVGSALEAREVLRPLLDRDSARWAAELAGDSAADRVEEIVRVSELLQYRLADAQAAHAFLAERIEAATGWARERLAAQLLVQRGYAGELDDTIADLVELVEDPAVSDRTRLVAAPVLMVITAMQGRRARALDLATRARVLATRYAQELPWAAAEVAAARALVDLECGGGTDSAHFEFLDDDPAVNSPAAQLAVGLAQLLRGEVAEACTNLQHAATALIYADPHAIAPVAFAFGAQSAVHAGRWDTAARLRSRFESTPMGTNQLLAPLLARPLLWCAWALDGLPAAAERGLMLIEQCRGQGLAGVELSVWHTLARLGVAWDAVEVERCAAQVDGSRVETIVQHLRGLSQEDPRALMHAADAFAAAGMTLYAADAYVDTHRLARRMGERSLARVSDLALTRILRERGQVHTARLREWTAHGPLTARERQVVDLARSGASNREIATRLGISQRTAETHLHRAYTKMGTADRTQL